jgi:hypothetical protein
MQVGAFSFILQDYYVREWADNFVVHVTVSDVGLWWDHIGSLDLASRYGVKLQPPEPQGWAVVARCTRPRFWGTDCCNRSDWRSCYVQGYRDQGPPPALGGE